MTWCRLPKVGCLHWGSGVCEIVGRLLHSVVPIRRPGLNTDVEAGADIAVSTLLNSALNYSSDTARIAAATSTLDRGYGKPKADLVGVVDLPAIVIRRFE